MLRRCFALLLVACQPTIEQNTSQPVGAVLDTTTLPVVTSLQDVERLSGKKIRLQGLFDVERVKPTGKGGPFVYVVLPDGTHLVYQYTARELAPQELAFIDKQVEIIGEVYPDANQPPYVQQLMAPHVFPDTIKLAAGETPYETPPVGIPAPPVVETRAQLWARAGRWVQARGVLSELQKEPNSPYWVGAALTLTDGTRLPIKSMRASEAEAFVGKQVLLVAVFDGAGFSSSPVGVCDGALPSCEMPSLERSKTKAVPK